MSIFDDPPTIELAAPKHCSMPLCARCKREVDGVIFYGLLEAEASCHGETERFELGKDGEINRQVCFR